MVVSVKMEHLVPEVLKEEKVIKAYLARQERRGVLETWAQEEYQVLYVLLVGRTVMLTTETNYIAIV